MMVKELQAALADGHRLFQRPNREEPAEVIDWAPSWVTFRIPGNKYPISTNIRTFSMSVTGTYTENKKSPEPTGQ
ncbi:hypothetical protein [Paenibacillus wynnii]|uniref:Uncharacterized protein n=1 Tax=Paenibacillus wynnii TaxID=268407 RepID=A0A098MEX6_9BACL|nr:hypothetical protein [Paenibacillus wynnii]KGE20611.1 hypothetical protein PWYN_15620 [Paenibacillus wynnii]